MASSKPSAEALPAVSVIVPVHNVAPWIGETLASVLNQTGFDDFEVLVVDDRSTDETPAVVQRLAATEPRLRLLHNDGPRGAAGARNCGLRHARGEWLAFLDGDDLWMPDNLRLKMDAVRSHPGIDIISSDFYNENRANRTVPRPEWDSLRQSHLPGWQRHVGAAHSASASPVIELGGLVPRFLQDEVLGNTGTMVVRRRAVEAVGGFDTTLEVGEDIFLWLQLARRGDRMLFIHQPLMFYRYRPGSLTNQDYPAHAFFAEKFLSALLRRTEFAEQAPLLRARLANALYTQCYHWRRVGNRRQALATALRLVSDWPFRGESWRCLLAALMGR
jgi:glycosyltransferase involved in cell wall biosynthesis